MEEEEHYRRRNSTVFPHNITIEDCRAAIKGAKGFKEIATEEHIFFNYIFCTSSSFPSLLNVDKHSDSFLYKVRRECRGLIFDAKTGKVVSRRFQKFFNVNENDESKEEKLDLTQPHVILEKLDGSLVAPYFIEGKVSFGTKAGMTDIAKKITSEFLQNNTSVGYYEFCQEWMEKDYTPLFEWCSGRSQIVVKYRFDSLILTGLRHNVTGEYVTYHEMVMHASKYNVPTVKNLKIEVDAYGIADLIGVAKDTKEAEGYVLRFDDGRMYKVKSDWYVERHHRQNATMGDTGNWHEKNVWGYALDKTLDDILSKFEDGERSQMARKFEEDLWIGLSESARVITADIKPYKDSNMKKGDFVKTVNSKNLSALRKGIYLRVYDLEVVNEETCLMEIVAAVKKLTAKATTLESAREFAPNARFNW